MSESPNVSLRERISIFVIVLTSLFGGHATYSQDNSINSAEVTPPLKEVFISSDGLIAPWRSSGCIFAGKNNNISGCYIVTSREFLASSLLSLYNEDGSLWSRFDVQPSSSDYFWTKKELDLYPISTGSSPSAEGPQYPNLVILRVTAASPHWIQVVANERTLSKKYVSKSDSLWKETTWDHWLADGSNLYLPQGHEPLLDAPKGVALRESANLRFRRVKFIKTDGDWAYVAGRELSSGGLISTQFGWIRWRRGNRLLVGCILNNFVVPEISVGEN